MLERVKYLHALDDETSRNNSPLSNNEREELLRIIAEKENQNQTLQTALESMKTSLETLTLTITDLNETNKSSQQQIAELLDLVRKLTKENEDYKALVSRSNQETFGSKSLSRKHKTVTKKTREQEKEEWTSKDDDRNQPSSGASAGTTSDIDQTKVKSENLNGKRGSRNMKYNRMSAAKVILLETTLDKAPENMTFKGYREVEEYTKKSYVECTVFKVALYEDEFGVMHEYYQPADPTDKRRPRTNVIPSTHCTPEFLSDLVIERFMMAVPFYREQVRHQIDRFTVSRNTNRNWINKGAELLKPLMQSLKRKLLTVNSFLNIDETWTRVRVKFKKDGSKLGKYLKKYVWVLVNKKAGITYYFYDNEENDSRGKRPIESFLGEYKGSIQSDGYTVYKHLSLSDVVHIMCWAHVRNRFEQAYRHTKDINAGWFVEMIGRLYRIEAECIMAHMNAAQIKERRNKSDVDKILKQILDKCQELLADEKKHKNGKLMITALQYMSNNWNDLIKYRTDGRYTIDNMLVERAIRPFTVTRKNTLHFSSEEGVNVAMTYHTLIETCKNIGLNAKSYFDYIFRCLVENKNYDPDQLLPEVVMKKIND